MTHEGRKKARVLQPSLSPVLSVEDLRRMLGGDTPVTDDDGNLRVEIIRGRGRRNQILWVPWEDAARLLTLHGDRAGILAFETSVDGNRSTGELP